MTETLSAIIDEFGTVVKSFQEAWSSSGERWSDDMRKDFATNYWQDIDQRLVEDQRRALDHCVEMDDLLAQANSSIQVLEEILASVNQQASDRDLSPC